MTFPNFDQWCASDVAQAMLKSVYGVMERASDAYGDERWRTLSAEYHLGKALVHTCTAHQFGLDQKENGMGARTGMREWEHALTRLAFVAAKMPRELPKAVEIDTRELELSE